MFTKKIEFPSRYGKGTYEVTRPTKAAYVCGGLVVLVVLLFALCFRTVSAGQVGVVTRFGAVSREANAGISLKLPWPIEQLHKFNVKTAKEQVTAQAGTKDSQIINSAIAVNYHIERGQAAKVYSQLGDKYLDTVLMPRVQTIFKNQTPVYSGNELLANRSKIETATLLAIQKEFDKQGIKVEQFSIIDFGFSAAISRAIESKQVAQQEAEKAVYVAQKAEQQANADIQRAKGQAESQRLLNETASDKTIELKQLEVQQTAIERWNGVLPTTTAGNGNIFNLPINK